jgi:hypothetical protein
MSGKQTVTLTFDGEHEKLERSFDSVGGAAKTMKDDVGSASRATGEGFDKVGEKFDATETRAMGFKDTLDGVGGSLQGIGEISKGNTYEGLLLLGQGVADTASGFANALIPAMKAGVGWLRNTTVAQRALNLVMRANPIGLIITGLTLLVGGLILAYKKSETFRTIVQGAMRAVQKAFGWIVDGFGNAWRALGGAWGRFTSWLGGWPKSIARWLGIGLFPFPYLFGLAWSALSGLWPKFTKWIGGWPASVGRWLGSALFPFSSLFGKAWTALSGAWSRFTKWVGGWKKAFSFSGMFDGIMGAAKSAFNWLIGKWNNLSFSLPSVDTHIPGVGRIGGWDLGTPDIAYFHTGGIVPGAPGTEVLSMLQAGEKVTPAGRSEQVVLVLQSDGSRMGDMLIELVRNGIRLRGGDPVKVLTPA